MAVEEWFVEVAGVHSVESQELLREYYVDVADRYYQLHLGRPGTPEEIETGLAGAPSDDLAPPTGVFLVGQYDGRPAACAGLRLQPNRTAELARLYVKPAFRGTGGGAALLTAIDRTARALGVSRIRLDTRLDLTEARALYLKHGYLEGEPHKEDKYAEVFYSKVLG
ncbi:GNAT family N-acetyltransferase [Kribbella sp. CA-293567]|uniref:GNAT family N-acetyltransferase n=1 Tax=Kribbella sp. CA-293567 TaxID=3002436 RepID=UPI0022DD2CC3|nr:GNAT family N-acetyltransferase [Kribbella sp. CA-293567]WBQ07063.1 GNAT family N-acetyltransferase [Kribbella sp. CA-293567]